MRKARPVLRRAGPAHACGRGAALRGAAAPAADLDVRTPSGYVCGMSQPDSKHDDDLEPLTPEQRASVETWRAGGCREQPEVAALRKKIRGEPLAPEELALLAGATRKPAREAGSVPHARVEAMLEERRRRERG